MSLRLGDVELVPSEACPTPDPAWLALEACLPAVRFSEWPASIARRDVILLDAEIADGVLAPALESLVNRLSRATAAEARVLLGGRGATCSSLHWGAMLKEHPGLVFWRRNQEAFGTGAERVALPLFPVVEGHLERGDPTLHTAVIARRGRGVLLLGASGKGKSTAAAMARLAGWTAPCDDAAVVTWENGQHFAIPLPGAATLDQHRAFCGTERPELKALMFLEQAQIESLSRISWGQATERLVTSALLEVPASSRLGTQERILAMDALRRLARAVPAYRLEFTRSPSWLDLLHDVLPL